MKSKQEKKLQTLTHTITRIIINESGNTLSLQYILIDWFL